jgi:alkylation response protein AidB-like acyl-CoA dehydrogenase
MPILDPLAAAVSMHDTIVAHRQQTQTQRRIAGPVLDALRDAKLHRLGLTKQYDGWALPAVELLRVFETLARADASVAWVVWNNAGPCLYSRLLTPAARDELFADSSWMYANFTRPSGKAAIADGGYRVSGRWSLTSGCELAEWVMLMCSVEENGSVRFTMPGTPEMRLVFVHKTEFEIIDTWHVGGLQGTGSHDVMVDDCFVAGSRTFSPLDASTIDEPIGYVPMISTLAAGLSAQLLGVAQAAIETTQEIGRSKTTPGTTVDMRDRSPTQIAVASQAAAVNAARLYLHHVVESVWQTASEKQAPSKDQIADVWAAALHADEVARDAVDAMYAAAGTTAIYTSCPLEQAHRDVRVMLQHIVAQPVCFEEAGRHMLGLESAFPQLWG